VTFAIGLVVNEGRRAERIVTGSADQAAQSTDVVISAATDNGAVGEPDRHAREIAPIAKRDRWSQCASAVRYGAPDQVLVCRRHPLAAVARVLEPSVIDDVGGGRPPRIRRLRSKAAGFFRPVEKDAK
jgi:hypothetical protein